MGVYSFLSTVATITGPGGSFNLGAGAAAAEEGITIEGVEDKNVMQIGADGEGQHSLVASDARLVTIRLLKTSLVNGNLMLMYQLQSVSSALWGQNVITVVNGPLGDLTILQACAFKKVPTITYAKEAGMYEWTFDVIKGNSVLGKGTI